MLYLKFQIGQNRYLISTKRVVEVLPLVNPHEIAGIGNGVVGCINYRGHTVTLLDLTTVLFSRPALKLGSSRIVVLDGRSPATPNTKFLALLVENMFEAIELDPADFEIAPVDLKSLPCLGKVLKDNQGLQQEIDCDALLASMV